MLHPSVGDHIRGMLGSSRRGRGREGVAGCHFCGGSHPWDVGFKQKGMGPVKGSLEGSEEDSQWWNALMKLGPKPCKGVI